MDGSGGAGPAWTLTASSVALRPETEPEAEPRQMDAALVRDLRSAFPGAEAATLSTPSDDAYELWLRRGLLTSRTSHEHGDP